LSGEYSRSPEVLTNARKTGCFPEKATLTTIIGAKSATDVPPFDTSSSYFRLTTRVTLGTTEFTLYSLLLRGPQKVTPLLRSFGTL
jgi:hypothetical protein